MSICKTSQYDNFDLFCFSTFLLLVEGALACIEKLDSSLSNELSIEEWDDSVFEFFFVSLFGSVDEVELLLERKGIDKEGNKENILQDVFEVDELI